MRSSLPPIPPDPPQRIAPGRRPALRAQPYLGPPSPLRYSAFGKNPLPVPLISQSRGRVNVIIIEIHYREGPEMTVTGIHQSLSGRLVRSLVNNVRALVNIGLLLYGSAYGAEPKLVDLTHPFDADTVYWPTDTRGFQLEELAAGVTDGGWYYSANAFCSAEHGGTHLDAPIHFFEDGHSVDQIPLNRLVGPGVVIDVSEAARRDPDYQLSAADLSAHEAQHGPIPRDAIVLLRTGLERSLARHPRLPGRRHARRRQPAFVSGLRGRSGPGSGGNAWRCRHRHRHRLHRPRQFGDFPGAPHRRRPAGSGSGKT